MKTEKVPARSEVKVENTWRLEDMFASDELWFKEFSECEKFIPVIDSYKGKLCKDAKALLDYFKLMEEVSLKVELLAEYSMRRYDEDLSCGKYHDMKSKFMTLYVRINEASSFDKVEILSISEDTLQAYYKEVPELKKYERAIFMITRRREHVLSDKEEALLAKASQVTTAGADIASSLRDADMKFPDVKDKDGNPHPLSNGSYISYLSSEDRTLRENAFNTLYDTYASCENTLASALDAQVKQLMFNAKARHFNNTLEASLFENEVPVSVYKNLVDTVDKNMKFMYDYVALRKKLLGYDELHMYDLYTPMVSGADKAVPYEQAKETVLKALAPLGEDYTALLKEGFENRWIDVYENVGKRSGAYSAGGRPHPYVLLNYKDTLDHQFTLAHEMGHSIHTYYSVKNQPVLDSQYVIFVAEVASTCNEVLLVNYLLKNTEDKKEKAYLINHFLEQFRGTLYRQTMFAEFEMKINELAEANNALTAETLNNLYYELVKKYHGDSIIVDERIKSEWSRIPHFYYNFYVFQYATGYSAAVAIANRILKEGKPAVDDYKKFLSSGGSADPISLLKIAGVDMSTPQPIEEALKLFSDLIKQMEELMK